MKSQTMLMAAGFTIISIIWGSTWLAIKIGLGSVPPFWGVALRFTIALIILFVILRIRGERITLGRDSIRLFIVMGVFSLSLPFGLVYWAELSVASGLASILFGMYPFVVAVFSHFFLPNEKLNVFKVAGIVVGFIGVMVIFWSDIGFGDNTTAGMGAILLSTLMQGISLVVIKKKGHHISPISLTLGGMTVGVIIMYVIAAVFEDPRRITLDLAGVGSIVYLGTFGTVVTFVIYYWLLKRMEAVYLSLVSFVTPVLAVLLGTLVLDERLSPTVFSGSALVLAGILITHARDLVNTVKGRLQ